MTGVCMGGALPSESASNVGWWLTIDNGSKVGEGYTPVGSDPNGAGRLEFKVPPLAKGRGGKNAGRVGHRVFFPTLRFFLPVIVSYFPARRPKTPTPVVVAT